jgi:signal transduction histidine kinase/CheY-like chemotaxis protein
MTHLADSAVARAIAGVPMTVQRKFLVAIAIVVALLVIVGVLGLRVLSQANDRVETLGQLPQRVALYTELQDDSLQLTAQLQYRHQIITPCTVTNIDSQGECGLATGSCFVDWVPVCATTHLRPDATLVLQADSTVEATLSILVAASDLSNLGFAPPANELRLLREINSEGNQLSTASASLAIDDRLERYPDNQLESNEAADVVEADADRLVSITQRSAADLIAQNRASYLGSQHLFIGVAAASIALALLLGVMLSWALVGPIKTMRARLAAIASGDFSGHVEVPNRDELGDLAADLNRMNDELGRLYRDLENTSRHKSEFLANISHELRTPLNAVIGFSEVLGDRLVGDLNKKQAAYVADIHASGRHLLTLINDILDLSKIEAGRMELRITHVALADLLQHALALLGDRATRQGIRLSLEVGPNAGDIEADERMVKQVLFNLLSNGLKFTPRGGHVHVSARSAGDDLVVSVRDDGIGIAHEDQSRIFEEFVQVRTPRSQEGTGLGLALSRRLVELHGGHLWVESIPGRGSTFTFSLPRTQESDLTGAPDAPRPRETSRTGRSPHGFEQMTRLADRQLVLLVEDDEKNLRLARDLLQYHGFHTLEARDAETGLQLALGSAPDIILMDIELPDMDGITALQHLRGDPATARIRVVAVTASAMPADRERFTQAGFAGVILKPIEIKAFPHQVLAYCDGRGEVG